MIQTILLFFSLLLAHDACANYHLQRTSFAEDSWHFSYFVNYIKTTSNYTDEGFSSTDLGNDRFYDTFQNTLHSRWVIGENWGAFGEFSFAYVQTQNNELLQSRTGIRPLLFGIDYKVWKNAATRLLGDLQVEIPTTQIDFDRPSANEPLVSDEAFSVTPTLKLEVPFKRALVVSTLGLKWRAGGLSTLLPYSAGIEGRFGKWLLGSELLGAVPLVADNMTTDERHKVNAKAAGGSLIFNAVNPSYLNARLSSGYALGPHTKVRLGIEKTMTGTNTANSTQVFAGFWYGHQDKENSNEFKTIKKRLRKRKREQRERQRKFRTLKEKKYEEESDRERRRRLKKISEDLDRLESEAE